MANRNDDRNFRPRTGAGNRNQGEGRRDREGGHGPYDRDMDMGGSDWSGASGRGGREVDAGPHGRSFRREEDMGGSGWSGASGRGGMGYRADNPYEGRPGDQQRGREPGYGGGWVGRPGGLARDSEGRNLAGGAGGWGGDRDHGDYGSGGGERRDVHYERSGRGGQGGYYGGRGFSGSDFGGSGRGGGGAHERMPERSFDHERDRNFDRDRDMERDRERDRALAHRARYGNEGGYGGSTSPGSYQGSGGYGGYGGFGGSGGYGGEEGAGGYGRRGSQGSYGGGSFGMAGSGGYGMQGYGMGGTDMGVGSPDHEEHPQRGPHWGKGPKGYKRKDERIREEVCEAIAHQGNLDASDVEVNVENGVVKLTGTVVQRHHKRVLERIAEACRGVDEVENHLRLARNEPVRERPNVGSPTGREEHKNGVAEHNNGKSARS